MNSNMFLKMLIFFNVTAFYFDYRNKIFETMIHQWTDVCGILNLFALSEARSDKCLKSRAIYVCVLCKQRLVQGSVDL